MSNLSEQQEIVKQKVTEVDKGVKPSQFTISVADLPSYEMFRLQFMRKAGISDQQYRVLMIIKSNWDSKGQGISVYQVSKQLIRSESEINSVISMTKGKMLYMRNLGLIEAIGQGRYNCSLYAPSSLTGQLLRSLSLS